MIASKVPRAVKMRPIVNLPDSFAAAEICTGFQQRPRRSTAVIPAGTTENPVEIADDGSAAVFDISEGIDWDAHRGDVAPIARVIVRR